MTQQPPVKVDEQGNLATPKWRVDAQGNLIEGGLSGGNAPEDTPLSRATSLQTNLGESATRFVRDTYQTIRHPIDTAKTFGDLAIGIAQKMLPADQASPAYAEREQLANAMGAYFADRYGSIEGFRKAATTDPIGVMADLSTILTSGGAGAVRLASAPARLSRVGRNVVKAGELLRKTGDALNPLAVPALASGEIAQRLGTGIVEAGVRPPAAIKRQQNTPFESSRTIREQHIITPRQARDLETASAGRATRLAEQTGGPPFDRSQLLTEALGEGIEDTAKRKGYVVESQDALIDLMARLERDLPPEFDASDLLGYRRFADRAATQAFKSQDALLPGSPVGVEGMAQQDWANTARRNLSRRSPAIAAESDNTRRLMLANAAMEAGAQRPHLLSKFASLGFTGAGNPVTGAGMLALDSPMMTAAIGALLDILGKFAKNPETRGQIGAGRLVNAGTNTPQR
jgi:hypothetical protein